MDMFARIIRERHPGLVVMPLGRIETYGAVVVPAREQIVRPFATPEDRSQGPICDNDWNYERNFEVI